MRDLLLWRLLRRRFFQPEEITPLLQHLAERSFFERMPFFGFLTPATQHENVAVREAAVRVFRGAKGRFGLQPIVAALSDPEASVRKAAVEALRESVLNDDWARWAHAFFHPNADVRLASIEPGKPFPMPFFYRLYLLPDPVCRDEVIRQIESEPLPAEAIMSLFDFHKRGILANETARRLGGKITWEQWFKFFCTYLPGHGDFNQLMHNAVQPNWPDVMHATYNPDPLDTALYLFWDDNPEPPPGEPNPQHQFFDTLREGMRTVEDRFRGWVVFTLLSVAVFKKHWPLPAAEICAIYYPPFIACPWVPKEMRLRAIAGIHKLGSRCPVRDVKEVETAFKADVCRKPDGSLDTWAVAGIAWLLGENARKHLGDWIKDNALVDEILTVADRVASPAPEPPPAPAPEPEPPAPDGTIDADVILLDVPDAGIAQLAAKHLIERGEEGQRLLLERLRRPPVPPTFVALAEVTRGISAGPMVEAMRALVRSADTPPEVRFRIGITLAERHGDAVLPTLLEAVQQPGPTGWFTQNDREWLELLGADPSDVVQACLRSPHHYANDWAVEQVFKGTGSTVTRESLLREFLEAGSTRSPAARERVARWFADRETAEEVLPILFGVQPSTEQPPKLHYAPLFRGLEENMVVACVNSVLATGLGHHAEDMLLQLLKEPGVYFFAREDGLGRLMANADSIDIRKKAREALGMTITRLRKLRRVADTFAWGVRMGRQLTGKLFSIEMIAGEELGYTRFRENKLYITPMPILRGQLFGREVVRALILHEYGHHMYHRGEKSEEIWEQSESEGLQRLLNLVSDEHLERNLRALDRSFGDQLKLLASYAFQHTSRDFAVDTLLNTLQAQSFQILSSTPLSVARRRGCVTVTNGKLLSEMERAGMSFARFIRALRMGLGNRHKDPKVEQGLALFKGKFRQSTMEQMLEIAKKLREIFGDETSILESFGQDEVFGDGDIEEEEGISREELNQEVQNTLRGERRVSGLLPGGTGMNKGPEENFDLITKVEKVHYDRAQQMELSRQVQRQAEKMRRYFRQLGLGMEQTRFRLRGRSFDRSRARAVVLKGDPRMLIARELREQTDLFLGLVIDCSGSMSNYQSMEKAKRFGALLADAARDNRGIDVRVFGFTDKVIYDAGNARRCAVHSLIARGGNNDSAGLWHCALEAMASQRRAKLLVMISDGAPTECTATSLKALVKRLTERYKMCCAQVAVRPLEEVCFPNYVLLQEDNINECVRQFGAVMGRLVRKALGAG